VVLQGPVAQEPLAEGGEVFGGQVGVIGEDVVKDLGVLGLEALDHEAAEVGEQAQGGGLLVEGAAHQLAAGDLQELRGLDDADIAGAAVCVKEAHLAEGLARAEGGDDAVAAQHVGPAREDDVERVAEVALADEQRARLRVDDAAHFNDRAALGGGHVAGEGTEVKEQLNHGVILSIRGVLGVLWGSGGAKGEGGLQGGVTHDVGGAA
jgi:hypothetical protein